jgi:hypothetical protein
MDKHFMFGQAKSTEYKEWGNKIKYENENENG